MAIELRELLEGRVSPELVDTLSDLYDLLKAHNFYDHDDEIDYLAMIEETLDATTVADSICTVMRTAVFGIAKRMGVIISDEMPFQMLTDVIEALLTFGPSDDYAWLESVLSSENTEEEILCEVLASRTVHEVETLLPHFEAVDGKILATMKEILTNHEEVSEQAKEIRDLLNKVNLYHTENPNLISTKALQDGIQPGTSMEHIYQHYESILAALPTDKAVKSLVGFGLLSGLGMEAIQDEVNFFLEDLYPSIESNMQANKLLKQEVVSLESLFADL